MADAALIITSAELNGGNGATVGAPSDGYDFRPTVSAGDVNGDGFDDFIMGAPGGGPTGYGATYIAFGGPGLSILADWDDLNGANGFRLTSSTYNAYSGYVVSALGDIDDDGFDDLLVSFGNSSYVVFGQAGFAVSIAMESLAAPDAVRITGFDSGSEVGDFNGDGFADMAFGDRFADNGAADSGSVWIVFGTDSPFGATFDPRTVNGVSGLRFDGGALGVQAGRGIEAAGDLDGDGFADLLIRGTGTQNWVVYGEAGNALHELQLDGLDGTEGFKFTLTGPRANTLPYSVTSVGDINGDGHDDLAIVGSTVNGAEYAPPAAILYGGGLGATIDPTNPGAAGFRVILASHFMPVASMGGVGDVNADGIDDFAFALTALSSPQFTFVGGSVYVIYGRAGAPTTGIDLANFTADQGFIVQVDHNDVQSPLTVSGTDNNGDGYSDILISSGDNGRFWVVNSPGPLYVEVGAATNDTVNGRAFGDLIRGGDGNDTLFGLAGSDRLEGGDMGDLLHGGDGGDRLFGDAGGDVLNGDAGDDALDGGDASDKLYAGTGADTLIGGLGNDRMDGGDDNDSLSGGDGADTLDGGSGQDTLTGGLGNDVYILHWQDYDTVVEAADGGYDLVRADRELTMADNIEAVEMTGAGHHSVYGNALANNIQGNGGENLLQGQAGVDTINGNDGDDVIVGGLGNDLLRGGLGQDDFYVFQESIARPTLETDQIYDFSTAEGDIINLSFIDAIVGGGDDAFTFVGTTFTRQAGEMTLTFAGGITTLRLDQNGDGKVDYQMKINGDVTGDSGGWAL